MIGAQGSFPANYLVEECSNIEGALTIGLEGTYSRAISVIPFGDAPSWCAVLRVPRPTIFGACSGNFSSPDPGVALLCERGTVFRVPVGNPTAYELVRTPGPSMEVVGLVDEGLTVLATPWALTAIDASGTAWTTRRLSVEGIRLLHTADGFLAGLADPKDDDAREFRINLRTGQAEGGAEF